jgi:CarD family transcriptional regulator
MTFIVGDQAVYPAHGVGLIKGVESREIAGNRLSFYILKIIDTGMTIMVPTANADAIGMRAVIDQDKVEKVYDILRQRDVPVETQTWNRRYRDYMGKIKTGSLFEIAKVMRDLSILKSDKNLSFGERKMLDTARNLLVKEISVAKNLSEEVIENELHGIFHGNELSA